MNEDNGLVKKNRKKAEPQKISKDSMRGLTQIMPYHQRKKPRESWKRKKKREQRKTKKTKAKKTIRKIKRERKDKMMKMMVVVKEVLDP